MKKQKIEDIFSSMEDFSSVPPPELWSQIEEKLDKPKKKKRAILWWSAAACLLLGLLLPSVLHFSSNDSGIKVNNSIPENNNVVLDQKKNEENKYDKSRTIENKENILKKQSVNNQISASEKETNQSTNSQLKQNQKAVSNKTNFPDKTNIDPFAPKVNSGKNIVTNNNAASGKAFVPAGENSFNSVSKNKAVAEKSYIPNKANSFNSESRYKLSDNEKTTADKILAEKTFTAGKQNKFNTASKNQFSSSIFEDNLKLKNNKNIAFNASNSSLYEKQQAVNANKEKQNTNKTIADNNIASSQKDNSKGNSFTNTGSILSKQDSVQLAELQNLEKGIITAPEEEKKKEDKSISKADKWALQLFAGVANSENYRNSKTLGNVNDSKQSNSYGVKTQYKINNKWAVASGFKINELGQSVANVSYLSAKNTAFFTPSDYYYTQNSPVQQIASNSDYVLVSNNSRETLNSDNIEKGNLDQNLRYFEMPLEVSYSVFNKNKTSINLNTGGFVGRLISNSVALDGTSLGENVNAKDYIYGSTLSSTIQYRVYKKTNVFVEPAVNYYINPLNAQSFNQFQWGLNFGLNVSF